MRREVTLCTKLGLEWQVSQQQIQKVPEFTSRRKKEFFSFAIMSLKLFITYIHVIVSPVLFLVNYCGPPIYCSRTLLPLVLCKDKTRDPAPKALITMKMKSLLEDSGPQENKFIVLQICGHFPPLKSSGNFSFLPLLPLPSSVKCISENSYLCPEFKDLQLCYFMWKSQRACF